VKRPAVKRISLELLQRLTATAIERVRGIAGVVPTKHGVGCAGHLAPGLDRARAQGGVVAAAASAAASKQRVAASLARLFGAKHRVLCTRDLQQCDEDRWDKQCGGGLWEEVGQATIKRQATTECNCQL
jgi:hypothetical protein